jgi:hypothetical protein
MRDRARLPLVEPDAKNGIAAEVFAQILATGGEVTNLFRDVANEPALLSAVKWGEARNGRCAARTM